MDLTIAGAPRRTLSAVAVAATLPYLSLKLLWLSGSTLGFHDAATGHAGGLWLANLVTFGMDAVALLLALTFVHPRGHRVPAGLMAFPMWVATGLLGTILIALPIDLVATAVLGPETGAAQQQPPLVAPWVFTVVYGGFTVQGLALLGGFALYARRRWAGLLADRIGDLPRTPTLRLQQVLTAGAGLLALLTAAVEFGWAAGLRTGLPTAFATDPHRSIHIMQATAGVMLLVAAVSLHVVVHRRRPAGALRPWLLAAWLSSGSVLSWSAWDLFAGGLATRAPDLDHAAPGLYYLVLCAQLICGLLLLLTGSIAMIERAAARVDVESAG